jgi:hypothetical protein
MSKHPCLLGKSRVDVGLHCLGDLLEGRCVLTDPLLNRAAQRLVNRIKIRSISEKLLIDTASESTSNIHKRRILRL